MSKHLFDVCFFALFFVVVVCLFLFLFLFFLLFVFSLNRTKYVNF